MVIINNLQHQSQEEIEIKRLSSYFIIIPMK